MKNYKAYLLDLDGTIYHGKQVIPEAVQFVENLKQAGIPFLYLTNNSSATPVRVAERLTHMGLPTDAQQVYTTSMATATYLLQREVERPTERKVYIIGEEGIYRALEVAGFTVTAENPNYVVVGIDRTFTYEKLTIAASAIRSGATFISTNLDAAVPTEHGLRPGSGSLAAAVTTASGVKPLVIGKPEPIIVSYALEILGTKPEETLIVGDNLATDIEAGANSDIDSLLVLTGYSTRGDAERAQVKPTHIADSLLTWWKQVSQA